ncbi:unnamed protein product [Symbiodinium natans]|uniref:Uncharacterized protein n=1 Tax=Symbiodinium natans TaxID=878477 RepID=A0A812UI46_9DINO|nr:unnamed protein product [Symbiodinium natans]
MLLRLSAIGLCQLALATFHRSQSSSNLSTCPPCDIDDWNDESFKQCNFWGDPHITSSYGDLDAFDFQGIGLFKWAVSSGCGYKFQVNAFTCRYTPRLWSNSITRYLAIQMGDDIIYINNTNVGGSGLDMVDDPTFSRATAGVNIQSPDKCFRMNVNVKPLDGGLRWYHNVKLRIFKDVLEKDGICGSSDLLGQLVYSDDSDTLFTDEQLTEMCTTCTDPNAPPPLGCPGTGPGTNSPGCEFMSQSSNLNSFECTEDKLPKDGSSVEAGNLSTYQGLTKNGDHCLAYVKTKGGGSSASCAQYCEDIGSTCVGVWDQLSGTTCALDPINITVNHGATCHNRAGLRDMLCICDKPSPDNPFPGPSPGRVCGSAESFNEAVDLCKVCLPNAEFTDAPVAEQDKRLRSCVIDICSLPGTATLDDKEAIAENSCEQDPDLPPDGMKVCSAAGFCEAICVDNLVFPTIGVSACHGLCKPIFESKVKGGLRGFCDYKDTCSGYDCSDSSYYCPLLCQSLECDQNVQDGCSGCEQRCADQFADVDDILEEYCRDSALAGIVEDLEKLLRSCSHDSNLLSPHRLRFCAEYCKSDENGNNPLHFDPAECIAFCTSDAGYNSIIGIVESKFCPHSNSISAGQDTTPSPTTSTPGANISICDDRGFCDAICDIGFAGAQCRADCGAEARKITRTFCRCGVCSHSMLQETEEVGLLHFRAPTPGAPELGGELSSCRCRNPSYYCKKLCDDGFKRHGDRELVCVESCLVKFPEVLQVLETYEDTCPACQARRGDDDKGDDDRRNDDDKKRDSGGAFMSVVRRIHILPFHDGTFLVDAHVESLFLKTAILCCESTIASMLVDGRRNKD